MNTRFFEVEAKCGHVGKHKFYKGMFYVQATNGSEAAVKVRAMPRVKHHHKDAILKVTQISYQEFVTGQSEFLSNPYFRCQSKREQNLIIDEIKDRIFYENKHQFQKSNIDRKIKLELIRKWQRKCCKYSSCLMEA